MLLQRANKYRAEPSPYQAQAMGQWVGACRHEYNHALERRQYEYRNYGFSLAYVPQAKELTVRRAAKNWLEFVPIHALQNALRDLDEAFSRFFKKLCGHPTPRKKFKNDSFTLPAEDVKFKQLNKRHGAIKLPKIGWVRFRGYRPLGGDLRSVTFRRKAVAAPSRRAADQVPGEMVNFFHPSNGCDRPQPNFGPLRPRSLRRT